MSDTDNSFDIFNNRTPWYLLTEYEKNLLQQWYNSGGKIECVTLLVGWYELAQPSWDNYGVYRAMKPVLTKPSINWDHVAKVYNWLAFDEDGSPWVFDTKPYICDDENACWASKSYFEDSSVSVIAFTSYERGNCDWKDSLVCRPGYDGE